MTTRTCFSPVWVPLTRDKCTIIDEPDLALVGNRKWFAVNRGKDWHAMRTEGGRSKRRSVYMHRVIMGAADGLEIDHKNHNGLDNRRANLRECTHRQNRQNQVTRDETKTSRFRGVSWSKKRGVWIAAVCINGRQTYLGGYELEEQAARAYDAAAVRHFGEFANPNFQHDHA
jgi:hypothetical protein